eukprot:s1838_g21.t1
MEQTDVSQTLAGTGLLAPAANVAEAMGVVDMAVQSVHVTGAGAARQSETSTEASTTPTSAATATQTLAHLQVQSSSLGAPSGSPQELGDSASTGPESAVAVHLLRAFRLHEAADLCCDGAVASNCLWG